LAGRPKQCLLAVNSRLQVEVAQKLSDNWSPQQISGSLKIEYADDSKMRVSHETIYKSLFVQARGVLKKELLSHLRTRRLIRRGKHSTTRGQPRGRIIDAVSIRERPAEVEDRAIPGHWEGDLLAGGKTGRLELSGVPRENWAVMVNRIFANLARRREPAQAEVDCQPPAEKAAPDLLPRLHGAQIGD